MPMLIGQVKTALFNDDDDTNDNDDANDNDEWPGENYSPLSTHHLSSNCDASGSTSAGSPLP